MIYNAGSASKVAKFLLSVRAVQLRPARPFVWASGLKAPIYCDSRRILSFPDIRTFIRQQMVDAIENFFPLPDLIAGVATGGVAIGALVAQELGLPFAYVRVQPKKHGLKKEIEGAVEKGWSAVVVEDLISTGESSLKAVSVLRRAGCEVKGLVALFTYGFEKAKENFSKEKCRFVVLCDYDTLIREALNQRYIDEKEMALLEKWRKLQGA